ncbi:MAG: HTH domain-containing protein [Oscillospiraceae bacterium]|nr:HTH domain-containing protein [Oscillospiraceae bacterium]
MRYTFLELAKEVLSVATQPLSVSEIWKRAVDMNLVSKLSSTGQTPEATLGARMYVDVKNSGENSVFIKVSNRPALFTLRERPNLTVSEPQLKKERKELFKERDLHKILSSYVFSDPHFNCHTTTIFHEKSKRKMKGQNSWLHPDIVGVRFPFSDYGDETRQLMNSMSINTCKIFSFEMKIELNFSTLREYYFQSVSNSSWANEGYLVALKYDQDPEFKDEIRRLNNAFGIGFIKLNIEDYFQSEIILSAKINDNLDWNTIDRLSEENEDFRNFSDSIVGNLQRGKLDIDKHFDETFNNPEELSAYLKDRKIHM